MSDKTTLPPPSATPRVSDIERVSAIADAANAAIGARAGVAAATNLLRDARKIEARDSDALLALLDRVSPADRPLLIAQLNSLLRAAFPAEANNLRPCCKYATIVSCACVRSYQCDFHGKRCVGRHH